MADTKNIETKPGGFSVEPGGEKTTFYTGENEKGNVDLTKKVRVTIGQYISKKVLPENTYGPSDQSFTSDVSLNDSYGAPTKPGADVDKTKAYVPDENVDISGTRFISSDDVSGATTSGLFPRQEREPAQEFASNFSKGQAYPQKQNGNKVLTSAPSPGTDAYVNIVLSKNRFTPDRTRSQFVDDPPDNFGVDPILHIPGVGNISQGRMAQVGVALSMRGSMELGSFDDGYNPTSGGAQAKGLIPSLNQLGILKVPNRRLTAEDVLDLLTTSEISNDTAIEIAPDGGQSWGTMNNVNEPFDGLLNAGQVALSLALTAATVVVYEGLATILSLKSQNNTKINPTTGIRKKGSFYFDVAEGDSQSSGFSLSFSLADMFGITVNTFADPASAIRVGCRAVFFGAQNANDLGAGLLGALGGAVSSLFSHSSASGYNIVVAREIWRSSQRIYTSIKRMLNVTNFVSGVQGAVGVIRAIKDSKLVAVMSVFAYVGDVILSEPQRNANNLNVNSVNNDAMNASVRKSRLRGSGGSEEQTKLAWSSNRAPSRYLLPNSTLMMQLADTKLGANRGPYGLGDKDSLTTFSVKTINASTSARISPEEVIEFEKRLDAEYVPFYFHDIRTNEIISFHAFLKTLSDAYTPAWEGADAYGRVDPVKIYKSTGRKIDLSFVVAATSEMDFDDMWMKVNKLVTLVYPQYTKGRTIVDAKNENSFIQPFSQLIGASPIIRLRVGDVVRSNYSRFALARLFGADTNEMKLEEQIRFESLVSVDEYKKAPPASFVGKTFMTRMKDIPVTFSTSLAGLIGGAVTPESRAKSLTALEEDLDFIEFTVSEIIDDSHAVVKPSISNDALAEIADVTARDKKKRELSERYDSEDSPTQNIFSQEFTFPLSALIPTRKTANSFVKYVTTDPTANIDKLSDFLSYKKNALVRSFRNVGGKGLAGTLDSLTFNWLEYPWETKNGSSAPKAVTVSLSFTVIHDISPGIDNNGYNRAPNYPVGAAMGTNGGTE